MSRKIGAFLAMLVLVAVATANQNDTVHDVDKRQSPTLVADFYLNSGATGVPYSSLYAFNGFDSQRNTSNAGALLVATSGYGISSLRVYNQNWLVLLYDNWNCLGNALAFRTTAIINNLADYGYNDWAQCLKAQYVGPIQNAVTLFEDSNYGGRSAYVTPGSSPNIATASSYLNNVRADRLSSMEVYPNTQVNLYKDTFYGGQKGGPAPSVKLGLTTSYPSMSSVPPSPGFCNDCASSIQVY